MEYLQGLKEILQSLTDVLGISLSSQNASATEGLSEEEIEAMIAERRAAKKEKNFARADEIRASLLEQGIVLEDTREGVRWKRA